MALILANCVCLTCLDPFIVVMDTEHPRTSDDVKDWGHVATCDVCGDRAEYTGIYVEASLYPEVEALVRFDRVRRRLRLPTLSEAQWH